MYNRNNDNNDNYEQEKYDLENEKLLEDEHLDEYEGFFDTHYEKRKLFFRATGFILLIIFVTFVLTNFIRIFTLPPLDFLNRSGELLGNPEISKLQKSVVQVKVDGGGIPGVRKDTSRGSGFNICEDGFIVTNRHIVEDGDVITVLFEDDGVYRVKETITPSTNLDLAFLRLEEAEELPVVKMSEDPKFSVDDKVIIIGNPLGFSWVAKEGRLADLVEIGNYGPLLEVYAPIYPGSSGSPIFDSEGMVIGIIYAARQINEDEIRGIAFNTREIIKVMKDEEIILP